MKKTEIQKIYRKQKEFFYKEKTYHYKFRLNALKKLKQAIINNEVEIIEALKKDMGKPETEAYLSEIYFTIMEIDYLIKNLKKLTRLKKVSTPWVLFKGKSYIKPEPYGTVLIISPWNYPFQLLMAPLAGAIAAGNTVILKPSELAQETSKVLTMLVEKIFAEDYVSCVDGGIKENQILLSMPFDYIFYTGSTAVGRIVMEAAAKNLTPVTLELGGKSPCIVDKNCDLDKAAKRIIKGKFFNAGQTCIAPDYVYVHYSVKSRFIKYLQKYIHVFYGEDPSESPDYARIINKKHYERLVGYLKDGYVCSGGKTSATDLYIAPTIMDEIKKKNTIMQNEIFGPILPVMEFKKLNTVIDYINDNPKPLSLYIFSENKNFQNRIVDSTSSGGICINDTLEHIISPNLPFGGVGDSGMGQYHGKASFDVFTHYKSILKKSMFFDLNSKYPPYSAKKLSGLRKLLKFFG